MLYQSITLTGMPLTLPRRQILSRLGYSEQTRIPASQLDILNRKFQRAFATISAKGICACQKIVSNDGETVILADQSRIACPAVAGMLNHCQEVWLAATTVGKQISDLTAACFSEGDAAAAAVCDAVGSECADAAMDFLQNYAATQLKRSKRILTDCRFSPGYGNWLLTAQQDFFRWLNLQNLGLTLTDSLLLIPEKSVTALAGVKVIFP